MIAYTDPEGRIDALIASIVNDGATYHSRVEAVRFSDEATRAQCLFRITVSAARLHFRSFGDKFTAEEIFAACAGVLAYMKQHVEECDRVAREEAILKGREVKYRKECYAIVPSDLPEQAHTDFRVVNLVTGDESSLYSYNQCGAIIGAAVNLGLKGSFDLQSTAKEQP